MRKILLLFQMTTTGMVGFSQLQRDTIILGTFTIQGLRESDSSSSSARPQTGIEQPEIQHRPQQSIQEGLNEAAGLDVRSRGPLGVQSDLSIRGGTFDQSLVMIDGVKLADPQTGHHMLDLPFLPEDLAGVEQINNGGSRWFGPYAFSGAVNLILNEPSESGIGLRLTGGDYGYFNGQARLHLVNSLSATSIVFGRNQSDGYQQNTDFTNDLASVRTSAKFGKHKLKVFAGQTNKAFGAQNFYSVNYPYQHEQTITQIASLQAGLVFGRLEVTPRISYRRHTDRFDLFRTGYDYYREVNGHFIMNGDTIPSWYSGPNFHASEVISSELNVSYKSILGTTHVGGEYREEGIYSNNLGETMDEPISGPGSARYTKHAFRSNTSIFFEQNKSLGRVSVSLGVLANEHSVFGRGYYPGADIKIRFSRILHFFSGVNYNTRFPTYTDLYYNLGGAIGSIDLKPEHALSYQGGIEIREKQNSFTATAFVREGKNLIDWVRINGSTTTRAANLTEVQFIGLECTGHLDLSDKSSLLPFTGITLRTMFLQADMSSEGFESNYVLDYLKYKVFLGLHHRITETLSGRWSLRWQDREGGFIPAGGTDETPYDPYAVCDVRIYQSGRVFGWYVEVSNLFNTSYREIGGVQQAGRWLRIGVSCDVGFKKKS